MYTKVKTDSEITAMRHAGKLLATVHATLKEAIAPGMTTKYLADLAARELRGTGGTPSFLGYQGFPDVICISVNDEVVHGIPGARVIEDGDLIGLDFGVTYDGMITDSAISVIAGDAHKYPDRQKLLEQTRFAMMAGIKQLKDGVTTGDIGHAIESILNPHKYGIVSDLVGHGVGHELHEDPNIPNQGKPKSGHQLEAGMTIAIEPMATLGTHKVHVDQDGWTIKTNDGSIAAHFEHTVLITDKGFEILTTL